MWEQRANAADMKGCGSGPVRRGFQRVRKKSREDDWVMVDVKELLQRSDEECTCRSLKLEA